MYASAFQKKKVRFILKLVFSVNGVEKIAFNLSKDQNIILSFKYT